MKRMLHFAPLLVLLAFFGKSSQISPKPVLIFWSSIPCLYIFLKVVGYYDLSVLSMSVMGFPQKKFGWWVGGWVGGLVSSIQVFVWIF